MALRIRRLLNAEVKRLELKLADGKYILGTYQALERISEIEELLQRVVMKLKARRGAFVPLPEYGSRLHLISQEKPSNRCSAARGYVLEALADEKELELDTLELVSGTDGEAKLSLSFTYKGEYTVNVETSI